MVEPLPSKHVVPADPKDTAILAGAMAAGVDYLVTNDPDLLSLDPYEGLRILSMAAYYDFLTREGLLV